MKSPAAKSVQPLSLSEHRVLSVLNERSGFHSSEAVAEQFKTHAGESVIPSEKIDSILSRSARKGLVHATEFVPRAGLMAPYDTYAITDTGRQALRLSPVPDHPVLAKIGTNIAGMLSRIHLPHHHGAHTQGRQLPI